MIFAVGHPLCDVWNQKKTQILIEFLDGTKKVQLVGKKSFLRFRGFRTWFLLLTTPYVMFESKKLKFLLLIKWKIHIDGTKKVQLGFRGFRTWFLLLTTPYVMLERCTRFLLAKNYKPTWTQNHFLWKTTLINKSYYNFRKLLIKYSKMKKMNFIESLCQHMKRGRNPDCRGILPENWNERNV